MWQKEIDDQNSYHYTRLSAQHGNSYEINERTGVTFKEDSWDGNISAARITGRNCIVDLESDLGSVVCTLRHGSYDSKRNNDFMNAGCKHSKIASYTVLGMHRQQ